ncbi:hypothetical protein, variant [Spizellomyces punctatus DAOM BR117]|nr:hypothetical protein, variant [Spizellomyces punctatus DAOM BR117]KNC96753.1 hypothetical protein, variant [Spizellomyces punctatus DAOM BR117]|eukprot:XP_016604793.1 hypothetical protein, variant [Spizellomyces punctatus DAOM BR117]
MTKRCVEMAEHGCAYLACCVLVTILERLLGDILFTVSDGDSSLIPFLLRDLLVTTELEAVLGSKLIFTMRILMGTPLAMNIRNILWHGFAHPAEFEPPAKIYFAFFMMILLEVVTRARESLGKLSHRSKIAFESTPLEEIDQQYSAVCFNEDLPPATLPASSLEPIVGLITLSTFPLPGTIDYNMFSLLAYAVGDYHTFLVSSIPMLEHALRIVYVRAAGEDASRLLVADNRVMYLTLDEMLADGRALLTEQLGHCCVELLLDMFSFPAGPRLRDRLSHGEANNVVGSTASRHIYINPTITQTFFSLLIYLMWIYSPAAGGLKFSGLVATCVDFVKHYHSRYHPVARIRQELVKAFVEIDRCFHTMCQAAYTLAIPIEEEDTQTVSLAGEWTRMSKLPYPLQQNLYTVTRLLCQQPTRLFTFPPSCLSQRSISHALETLPRCHLPQPQHKFPYVHVIRILSHIRQTICNLETKSQVTRKRMTIITGGGSVIAVLWTVLSILEQSLVPGSDFSSNVLKRIATVVDRCAAIVKGGEWWKVQGEVEAWVMELKGNHQRRRFGD